MKVTKITFEQLFPTGMYANQRLGVEVELHEDIHPVNVPDAVKRAYQYAKDLVEASFKSMNPDAAHMHDFKTGIPSSPPVINRKEIEKLEIDIDNCTSRDDLLKIRDEVIEHDDPTKGYPLMSQWNKKYKELSQ